MSKSKVDIAENCKNFGCRGTVAEMIKFWTLELICGSGADRNWRHDIGSQKFSLQSLRTIWVFWNDLAFITWWSRPLVKAFFWCWNLEPTRLCYLCGAKRQFGGRVSLVLHEMQLDLHKQHWECFWRWEQNWTKDKITRIQQGRKTNQCC